MNWLILLTSDGGFVAAIASYPNTGQAKFWLVKADSNGCYTSACAAVGIEEHFNTIKNNYLFISPNPASNAVTIEYKLPKNALTGKLIITDVTGKTIQYYDVIASLNQIYFNTSNLKGGIYFVNLICNNSIVKSEKLVVLK